MSAARKLWSLRDIENDHQVDELALNEVKLVLLGVAPSRMESWEALAPAEEYWQPLHELKELGVAPPPKKKNPLREQSFVGDLDEDTVDVDLSKGSEKRKFQRYEKKFKFKLLDPNISFSSVTENISLTGIHLRDPLPPELKGKFIAYLEFRDQKIKLKGKRVSSKRSHDLKILKLSSEELLVEWILRY